MSYHKSVLLTEAIEAMAIHPEGIYVDATYGGGGHAAAILQRLTTGRLIAFEQGEEAIRTRLEAPRLLMVHHNFRLIKNFLMLQKTLPADGILADLGLSSHQIDAAERGFSTRFDGILDMRMDRNKKLTAREIVNQYSEEALTVLFRNYAEVHNARKLAATIITSRKKAPIETTGQLKEIVLACTLKGKENKYLAQVFQGLRIEVNQEMESLREFLKQATACLKPGGKLVVIAYHSLEDKLVKNYFRSGNFEGMVEKDFYGNVCSPLKVVNRKAIVASEEEVKENSRARSARLRIAEKR